MKKIIVFLALSFIASAFSFDGELMNLPDTSKFSVIQLKDGSSFNFKTDVKTYTLASDRDNGIDFIELRDGRIIDSSDIKSIKIQNYNGQNFQNVDFRDADSGLVLRLMGDGSGG